MTDDSKNVLTVGHSYSGIASAMTVNYSKSESKSVIMSAKVGKSYIM